MRRKTNSNTTGINATTLLIATNINEVNIPTKTQRCSCLRATKYKLTIQRHNLAGIKRRKYVS